MWSLGRWVCFASVLMWVSPICTPKAAPLVHKHPNRKLLAASFRLNMVVCKKGGPKLQAPIYYNPYYGHPHKRTLILGTPPIFTSEVTPEEAATRSIRFLDGFAGSPHMILSADAHDPASFIPEA